MDTIKQLKWRYATKKFNADKKLSQTQLDVVKQAFNLTATSFGLQTIKLIIIEDKTIRESLVPHSYYQKQVLEASHLLVLCIQNDVIKEDVEAYYDNIQEIRQTSDAILDPYKQDLIKMMTGMTLEQRQQWSTNQAFIALGNLMTVCAFEGIDSCPMEGFVPSKYDEILHLEDKGLKSVLLLPIGYRADDDMFADFKKVRKPLKEAVIEL